MSDVRRALDTLKLSETPNFSHTTPRQPTEIDYEEKNHFDIESDSRLRMKKRSAWTRGEVL